MADEPEVNEDVAPEAEAPEVEETPTEAPASWSGPSQEEWGTVVGALREIYQRQNQPAEVEEEEPDLENLDLGEAIQYFVDQRMSEFRPVAEAQMKEQGTKNMNQILDSVEKELGKDSFDRKLAERAGQAYFTETGIALNDPRAAEAAHWATIEGAKYAAAVRKQEREAAIEDYKKSLKPDENDPAVSGGGVKFEKKPESLDDVIAQYEATYGRGSMEVG